VPWTCYSYPPSAGNRSAAQRALPGVRRMPLTCFTYSEAVQPEPGNSPNAQGGGLSFPATWCFSYPGDLPRGGNSDAAQPHPPRLRQMP
jgi:hypothetical protein